MSEIHVADYALEKLDVWFKIFLNSLLLKIIIYCLIDQVCHV